MLLTKAFFNIQTVYNSPTLNLNITQSFKTRFDIYIGVILGVFIIIGSLAP